MAATSDITDYATEVRTAELRIRARLLRSLERARVHGTRCDLRSDLLDAEQLLAIGALEPVRLLFQARRRILTGQRRPMSRLHILYDYYTNNVKVVNSTLTAYNNMTASATVYNIPNLAQQYTNQVTLNVPANASTQAFTIPALSGLSTTYFIRLQLKNSLNQVVSNNLYWYSTSPDTLGNKSNWYSTAVSNYANLTGLNSLASNSSLTASASRTIVSGQETVTITLNNTSTTTLLSSCEPKSQPVIAVLRCCR